VKKFLVLYQSSVPAREMMANATPEQAKAGMDAWTEWMQRAGDAIVDIGAPLGGGSQVTEGSTSVSTSDVTGYSIVQADTADDAARLLQQHPHFMTPAETSIEVLEALPMPGT
jgi:hypothetical protein